MMTPRKIFFAFAHLPVVSRSSRWCFSSWPVPVAR